MDSLGNFTVRPVGVVRSHLTDRALAPRQGSEGAPDAWLEIDPPFVRALDGIVVGDDVIVLTWLHLSDREVLEVHPRSDPRNPLAGVFATRSPDRPNPIGLHRVRVEEILPDGRLRVSPLEAVDGTPVLDIKPVLSASADN